jgi:hypothetical protein
MDRYNTCHTTKFIKIVAKLLLIHMLKPILEIKRSTGNKTACLGCTEPKLNCRDTHRANQKGLQ